jgi:hypothetical protein
MTNQIQMSNRAGQRGGALRHWGFMIPSSLVFRHSTIRPRHALRSGLSLLEVILSIAILGGALAVIGELVRIGARNAAMARDLTTAQLFAESKMNEVAAGVADFSATESEPLDEEGDWVCAVTSTEANQQQLMAVTVTVGQNPDTFARPVSYALTRWIIDPAYVAECAALDAKLKAEAKQAVANAQQSAGNSQGGGEMPAGSGAGSAGGGGQASGGAGGGFGGGLPGGGQAGPGGGRGGDGAGRGGDSGGRGGRGDAGGQRGGFGPGGGQGGGFGGGQRGGGLGPGGGQGTGFGGGQRGGGGGRGGR